MLKNREKLYQAYQAVLSMALAWAFLSMINQYYILKVPVFVTAVFSVVSVILVYLYDLNKRNTISYILILSSVPLFALIFGINRIHPVRWFGDFILWCTEYNGTEGLYKANFAYFAIISIALASAILFYALMKKQRIKLVLACVILAVLITLSITKTSVGKVFVGICIFYILTTLVELYGSIYSKKTGIHEKKEGILYLSHICLVIVVVAVIMPSQAKPYQWTAVKGAYHYVKEQVEIWQANINYYFINGDSEFFLSFTGYSEESGELNNGNRKLLQDDSVALEVSGDMMNQYVYLSGSVSDIYTGSSWKKSKSDYLPDEKEYLLDYMELFAALARQDIEVLKKNRFLKNEKVSIVYNNIKTKSFFYPLKTSSFTVWTKNGDVYDEMAQIKFLKPQGKKTSYQMVYYEMNLMGNAFQNMLREADSFSYDTAPEMNPDTAKWVQGNILGSDKIDDLMAREDLYQILEKRSELMKSIYTQLPKELPDRVRALAEAITKDCPTTYDKLKVIEAYLKYYHYTLSPKVGPENEDFTDYFLFESKEGYCTSFATAMAVLGRCIGVPMRYVEGYLADCSGYNRQKIYSVKNSQAHAWAEAYIEGVGWIPFEATASYYDSRYTKWIEWADYDSANMGNEAAVDYSQYIDMTQGNTDMLPMDLNNADKKGKLNASETINGLLIVIAIIVCLIFGVLSYYYVLRRRYHKAFHKFNDSGKMYLLFLRILKLLRQDGLSLGHQETIQMFSMRVPDYYRYERVTFNEVAKIYMKYRYGEEKITKHELEWVALFHKGLAAEQNEKKSRFRLWREEFTFLIQIDRQLKQRYNNV